jgi:hypothetical protein
MRIRPVGAIAILSAASVAAAASAPVRGAATDYVCHTAPITHTLPDPSMANLSRNWVHVGKLWMGYLIAQPGWVSDPTGQKVPWYRSKGSAYGKLRVTGYRLDEQAPPLRTWIPTGYAITFGFQSSALYFPTPGCWRIVAHVGLTQRYEFTIRVLAKP